MFEFSRNGTITAPNNTPFPIDLTTAEFATTTSKLVVERIPTVVTTPLPASIELKARRWDAHEAIQQVNKTLEEDSCFLGGRATPARAGIVRALVAHELLVKDVGDAVLGEHDHVSDEDWETLWPLTNLIEVTTRCEPRWHITVTDEDGEVVPCGRPYSPEIDGAGDFPAAATLNVLLDLLDSSLTDVLLHVPRMVLGDTGEFPERLELTLHDIATDADK